MVFKCKNETIFQQADSIRQLVLAKHDESSKSFSQQDFMRLLASFDVIEDCQCAIDYFKESAFPSPPDSYLYIYGLLQALFVQQDAINSILLTLYPDYEPKKDILCHREIDSLAAIREIRNDVAGHPTNRDTKEEKYVVRLLRCSLRKDSFSYVIVGNRTETRHVHVNQVIDDQEFYVSQCLSKIIYRLKGIDPLLLLQNHLS